MCSTANGTWLMCPPQLAPRVTVSGQMCQIPFTYGGMVRSDCVLDPQSQVDREQCPPANTSTPLLLALPLVGRQQTPASTTPGGILDTSAAPAAGAGSAARGPGGGGGAPVAPTGKGSSSGLQQCQPAYVPPPVLQPRYPSRFTLDGQRCLAPGPGALSECLDYDGRGVPQCQTASGAVFMCAPTKRNGSVSNTACAFPYLFRGFNRTDCVWIDGIEACKTDDGDWEECRPWVSTELPAAPPNTTARFSVMGQPCAMPFSYQGQAVWGCLGAGPGDQGFCRITDGTWQACAPISTNNTRTTITGAPCVLPFVSRNITYYDCIRGSPLLGSAGECLTREGRWAPCAPRPRVGAASGRPCIFPATWGGRNISDCVVGPVPSGIPACLTALPNSTSPRLPSPSTTIPTSPTSPATAANGSTVINGGVWEVCAPLAGNLSVTQLIGTPDGSVVVVSTTPNTTSAALIWPNATVLDYDGELEPFTAQSSGGGPSGPSSKHGSGGNKTLALALGLIFGLGGGLLLLGVLALWARREWSRRHRFTVMREMGFVGPAASQAVGSAISARTGGSGAGGVSGGVTGGSLSHKAGLATQGEGARSASGALGGSSSLHHRDASPAGTGQPGLELGPSAHTFKAAAARQPQLQQQHSFTTGSSLGSETALTGGSSGMVSAQGTPARSSTAERFARFREAAGLPVVPGLLPRVAAQQASSPAGGSPSTAGQTGSTVTAGATGSTARAGVTGESVHTIGDTTSPSPSPAAARQPSPGSFSPYQALRRELVHGPPGPAAAGATGDAAAGVPAATTTGGSAPGGGSGGGLSGTASEPLRPAAGSAAAGTPPMLTPANSFATASSGGGGDSRTPSVSRGPSRPPPPPPDSKP